MDRKKPVGILLCGTIFIFMGGFGSLIGIAEGIIKPNLKTAVLYLFTGISTLIAGFGVWELKGWARVIGQLVAAYWILSWFLFFNTLMYTKGNIKEIITNGSLCSIPAITILIYLTSSKVKERFKQP